MDWKINGRRRRNGKKRIGRRLRETDWKRTERKWRKRIERGRKRKIVRRRIRRRWKIAHRKIKGDEGRGELVETELERRGVEME